MIQLPAVASSYYCECSKCGQDRYHKVLTHTNATTVRLKCEVCGKTGNHNLEIKKAAATKTKTARSSSRSAAAKASHHSSMYESMKGNIEKSVAVPYNMRIVFKEEQVVQHPKFGLGLVRSVQGDKIEVFFEDEVRFLVHGRA
jgi:hypothetical protein